MKNTMQFLLFAIPVILIAGCTEPADKDRLSVGFEKYTLGNGLNVVLHVDKSDPIVSTAIMYHVGSSRENEGKTGFAHLFEHMLFSASENIPEDEYFKKIQNAGGTLNGFTTKDFTTYFEVVPKNALELILWMESDRMGYFINTVTQTSFAVQQNVVQNEKRQSYDNRPYGYTRYVIDKNIFPEGHPYHWQVIGDMSDIQNATVEDVKQFYKRYYGPNNATLVIAGDFDKDSVKVLVKKYFGEIARHGDVEKRSPMPVTLPEGKRVFHEDNFATVPQITMVWPSAQEFSEDAYALNVLGRVLSDGKNTPLYKVLVKEKKLTSDVSAYNNTNELAGTFRIQARANEGHSLGDLEHAIDSTLKIVEVQGISQKDLDMVKAGLEREFYNQINSVFYKSLQLAYYNTFMNDPGYIEKDIENIRAVTIDDVMNAFKKYIENKPCLITSFVPKGETTLAVENSVPADIVEEKIEEASEVALPANENTEKTARTPSSFDRSVEPPPGNDPLLKIPEIWKTDLTNGIKVLGIEQDELPLVNIEVVLSGGFYLDDPSKAGVASLISKVMMEGTKNKTPEQLEEETKLLGADISMHTSDEEIVLVANTLSRNYAQTMALIREILLEPRWDQEQFELARLKTINELTQNEANSRHIADVAFRRLLYGDSHIFANDLLGSRSSVKKITIDDLKEFYTAKIAPSLTSFLVAGNVSKSEVLNSLQPLQEKWAAAVVKFPEYPLPDPVESSTIYFVDVPGSKQSVINIGYLALSRNNPEFFPATVMNYKLGGSFSGMLNMILREEKGYTYGARSYFTERSEKAPFRAFSSVRSNATYESVRIFKNTMEEYRKGISQEDLDFTKNALIKSNARNFETLESLTDMLYEINKYNLPVGYIKEEESEIRNLTLNEQKVFAQKYIVPDKMVYLVVGDAKTQLDQLENIGFGKPVLLKTENGNNVE